MSRWRNLRSRAGGRAALVLAATLVAGTAWASHIDPLDPSVDILAARAFVGDPLFGLEVGDPGVIFAKNADSPAGEASTTKSWAMHIVTRAANQGLVDLDDVVTISANALIPRGHGHSSMGNPAPVPGDQFVLRDLLYATMIPSASDAIVAAAEYVAQAIDPSLASGAAREQAFVDLMNQHAQEIGLVDTEFFNPYGGDHTHDSSGGFGTSVPHWTTAREMAMWFEHAMRVDAAFAEIMGFRGTYSFSNLAGTRNYSFPWNPTYPGIVGQKGGSNASCVACLVAQARRIGRDMVTAYMQANAGGDGTTLLDYAFQTTFHPDFLAAGPKWGPVKEQALAVVNRERAVSAVVVPPNGMDLITWKLDVEHGSIQEIPNGFQPPCNELKLAAGEPGGGGGPSVRAIAVRRLDPGPPRSLSASGDPGPRGRSGPGGIAGPPQPPEPPGPGGLSAGLPVDVDIVHAGEGNLAVAVQTTNGLRVQSWGLPGCGRAFFRDGALAGAGSQPKLAVLNPGLLALGFIDAGGELRIQTWALDLVSGQLTGPLDDAPGPEASEFDLAAREQVFLDSHLVAALRSGGNLVLKTYSVSPAGQISYGGSDTLDAAQAISIARVRGYDAFRDVYATAYRRSSGQLRIRVHQMALDSSLTRVGDIDGTVFPMTSDGATAIDSYYERGVMVLVKEDVDDEDTAMTIWSLDDDPVNSAIDVDFVVASDTSPSLGAPEIERLPGHPSEGDFLISQEDFFEVDRPLQLEAWRSGDRP